MTIKPSDESLKQGRNRSWQAVHPQHPQRCSTACPNVTLSRF